PTTDKAAALREAAGLLDKAQAALDKGDKNLAEHYFSTAELITGPELLASIATVFREGAPPLVTAAPTKVNIHVSAQPRTAGSSEAEDEEAKVKPPPVEGSLTGTVMIDGKPL